MTDSGMRPTIKRSATCPGDINKRQANGSAAGLFRRCRSEGDGPSYHPASIFGRSANSVSQQGPNRSASSAHKPNPTAKIVHFAAPSVVSAKQTNTTASPNASVWGITDATLHPVPPHYPILMPSATFPGLRAEIVAGRVSDFFRRNSIQAQYKHSKAEVQALTRGNVDFVVRLWRAGGEAQIIMEVQRLTGSAPEFHRICRELFRAVQSGECTFLRQTEEEEVGVYGSYSNPSKTDGDMYPIHESDLLVVISEMIQCDLLETKELGIQALQFLCDPKKAGRSRALHVTNTILRGNTSQGSLIRDDLFSTLATTVSVGENGSRDGVGEGLAEFGHRLRGGALKILASLLETIVGDEKSSAAYRMQSTRQYWERLIPVLVADVDSAASRPHDALSAVEALRNFVWLSHSGREAALRCGILPILADANEFGHERHLSLETESLGLLSVLLAT